jgi:hypothetical protein
MGIEDYKRSKIFKSNSLNRNINNQKKIATIETIDTSVFTYVGQILNGNFNGQGEIIFKTITNNKQKYNGNFVDGKFNGEGKLTYRNGDTYEGDFVNNQFNGEGKITYANGNSYKGNFVNNQINGKGKFISDEFTYEGDFVDGKYYGKGKITPHVDGVDDYEGDFVDGEYNGYGTLKNSEGTYEGYFENDKYIGQDIGQDIGQIPSNNIIEVLKRFFQPPLFTIEQSDAQEYTYKIRSNDKSNHDYLICANITFLRDHIFINSLGKCKIKGGETLKIIEKIAEQFENINYISLQDVSNLDYHRSSINLYIYKILTKGQSWYNSLGYRSDTYTKEFKDNAKFKTMKIKKFQEDVSSMIINPAEYSNHFDDIFEILSIEPREINTIMSMTVPVFYEKIMDNISTEKVAEWLSKDLDFVLKSKIINYNGAELKNYIKRNGGFKKNNQKKRNTYKKISKKKKKKKSYSRKRTNKSVKYK